MFFDSHGHLNYERFSREKRSALAEEIEKSGKITYLCDVGFDLKSSMQAVEDAAKYSWCYAAVGVHPHDTDDMNDEVLDGIKELAAKEKVVAIGEIGLDFHYDFSNRENQRLWFRRQIQLANELHMPIIIHSREADQETMTILEEEGAFSDARKNYFLPRKDQKGDLEPHCGVLLHCYSGSAELAREYVKKGATISICGPVTFKNNKKTVQVVKEIPLEYLLIETDTPYLTPEPFRGKENRPYYVEYTARRIAEIKECSLETVAEKTLENATRFFQISSM